MRISARLVSVSFMNVWSHYRSSFASLLACCVSSLSLCVKSMRPLHMQEFGALRLKRRRMEAGGVEAKENAGNDMDDHVQAMRDLAAAFSREPVGQPLGVVRSMPLLAFSRAEPSSAERVCKSQALEVPWARSRVATTMDHALMGEAVEPVWRPAINKKTKRRQNGKKAKEETPMEEKKQKDLSKKEKKAKKEAAKEKDKKDAAKKDKKDKKLKKKLEAGDKKLKKDKKASEEANHGLQAENQIAQEIQEEAPCKAKLNEGTIMNVFFTTRSLL